MFANGGEQKCTLAPRIRCRATCSSGAKWCSHCGCGAKAQIQDEIVAAYLADTLKARLQQTDGTYVRAVKTAKDATAFQARRS